MRILRFIKHHKKLSIVALIILIVIAIFSGSRQPPKIDTQTVKRSSIVESISASGTVESEKSVNLNFVTAGKLVYLGINKGDRVEAGQVIATLDQRTIQKNLQTALRNYSIQRNAYDQTKQDNQNRTPDSALNDDMKRILLNNQNDLEKAILSVELQELARDQAVLVSPISGIVTRVDAGSVGINVAPTTTFIVADPDNVVFKIDLDEADIGKVVPGKMVKLSLDSYPNETVPLIVGSIDFTSHTSANGSNVFTVEAKMPQTPDYKYRIGMTGDSEIIIADKSDVLTVPLGSILEEKFVYVKKEKEFEKRQVTLGIQSDIEIEVLTGLKEGDEVAVLPDEVDKLQQNKKRYGIF